MKIVLQRVNSAYVEVEGKRVGSINKGYVAFFGVAKGDTKETAKKFADKILRLRIFPDENGKTNLSAREVNGEILVVSQFTLMADLTSNRPSFSQGASPEHAREIYNHFLEQCRARFSNVQSGIFASHMHVFAHNDGPFTLVLEG